MYSVLRISEADSGIIRKKKVLKFSENISITVHQIWCLTCSRLQSYYRYYLCLNCVLYYVYTKEKSAHQATCSNVIKTFLTGKKLNF